MHARTHAYSLPLINIDYNLYVLNILPHFGGFQGIGAWLLSIAQLFIVQFDFFNLPEFK